MMIAGEFNTPSDWPRTGDAITPIDKFAAAHNGNAPVFVFVDVGGSFNNDTECVNGPRGNVADHLTKDVPPYVSNTFGVHSANWGVVGWSMGGTCAVDLTVMHPELFSTFVDIAGDMGPNAGTKDQTIARLYGGDAAIWPIYDPTTVINKHGPYNGVSGWFAISSDAPQQRKGGFGNPGGTGLGGQDAAGMPSDQTDAANSLCMLGRANGIACAVIGHPGRHDWPLAADVFTSALPWLAGQIGTPGVPKIPLPGGGGPRRCRAARCSGRCEALKRPGVRRVADNGQDDRRPPDRAVRQDGAARSRPRAGRCGARRDRPVRRAGARARTHPHLPHHPAGAVERPRGRPRRRAGGRRAGVVLPLRGAAAAARRHRRRHGPLRTAAAGEESRCTA